MRNAMIRYLRPLPYIIPAVIWDGADESWQALHTLAAEHVQHTGDHEPAIAVHNREKGWIGVYRGQWVLRLPGDTGCLPVDTHDIAVNYEELSEAQMLAIETQQAQQAAEIRERILEIGPLIRGLEQLVDANQNGGDITHVITALIHIQRASGEVLLAVVRRGQDAGITLERLGEMVGLPRDTLKGQLRAGEFVSVLRRRR